MDHILSSADVHPIFFLILFIFSSFLHLFLSTFYQLLVKGKLLIITVALSKKTDNSRTPGVCNTSSHDISPQGCFFHSILTPTITQTLTQTLTLILRVWIMIGVKME